jgi:D-3-phosphoglycerate dehydrogenase
MKRKVLISAPYMQPEIDRFRGIFGDENIQLHVQKVNERLSEAELLPIITDVHGVICGDDRFTRKVLMAAKKLRVISKWGTGIDSIDRETALELGVRVCNTPNAFTTPVADSQMAAVLCFARRIPWMDRAMKSGSWQKIPGVSLAECTLGTIGVGNIGKAVARRAAMFGMTILGNDPKPVPAEFLTETGIKLVAKDELLAKSDFVCLN